MVVLWVSFKKWKRAGGLEKNISKGLKFKMKKAEQKRQNKTVVQDNHEYLKKTHQVSKPLTDRY